MAPKKKAEKKAAAPAEEEPPAKKAKVDEAEEKEEEPKVEPVKEKEEDDKPDKRPALKESVVFNTPETTLNVVPIQGGKILKTLADGGMQYLIAGARANTAIKAGRYFFEAKIVEIVSPAEGQQGRARPPQPKNLVRVGFSTAGSSLILGDGDKGVAFDADGGFWTGGRRQAGTPKLFRDVVIGVLINLDAGSPNANTVSLFRNGVRCSEPMPIPEALQGQPLYPHVSFRNVSLQVNFGAEPLKPLPFKCRTVGAAAAADCAVAKDPAPKDGKYEVLFPVAFPDEGTFEWLDSFLEKNPQYVELSDRKIQEWAVKSGVWKPQRGGYKSSADKPEYNFGLPEMDNGSARRAILSIAPVIPRHYVIMEVKQNLCETDRKHNLARFAAPCFKKVAHVVMGEPKADFKKKVQEKVLETKKTQALFAWKAKKAEQERKKKMAEARKKLAEERKKKQAEAAEAKKKAAEEKAAKEAEEKKEGEEEKKEEEKKEEEKKEEEKKEEEPAEEEKDVEMEDLGDEPPPVELSDKEKALWFKPAIIKDLTESVLNQSFDKFCIPEKSEGFDDVKFEWQGEAKSKEYLKTWVCKRKLEGRIEHLQPGAGFKKAMEEFQKELKEWKEKAKAPAKKSDGDGAADIMSVENICDIGGGVPLFANFGFEDWALCALKKEFSQLVSSFKEDVNDDERPGIHENHIPFYYQKYFKKGLNPKAYGVDKMEALMVFLKDTVALDDSKVLVSKLDSVESNAVFVKLAEQGRRERQRRIDAGDETARLNFELLKKMEEPKPKPAAPKPAAPKPAAAKPATPAAKPAVTPAAKPAVTPAAKPAAAKPAAVAATLKPTIAPAGSPAAPGPVRPGAQVAAKGGAKGVIKGNLKGAGPPMGMMGGKGKMMGKPQMGMMGMKGWGKGW